MCCRRRRPRIAALGFPIVLNRDVLGVMEFFSQRFGNGPEVVLQVMSSIGSQIGQFMERKRAEAALRESEQRFR